MTYSTDMHALSSDLLAPGVATLLLVLLTYLAGRVHQFFKQTQEREQAYRDGYNTATKSLFSLATRTSRGGSREISGAIKAGPAAVPMRGYASVAPELKRTRPARHRAVGRRSPSAADTKRYEDWPDLRRAA